jgi:capsular polysaccharide transport system permease protein
MSMMNSLLINSQVLSALVLRDVKSRVGGKLIGFLMPMFMPFAHLSLLIVVYTVLGRSAPLGTDSRVFFVTGVAPFVMFAYPMRQMTISIARSKVLLAFPRVKILDLVLAQAVVEILSVSLIAIVLLAVLAIVGIDFSPNDPAMVMAGLLSAIALGIGLGFAFSILVGRFIGLAFPVNLTVAAWYISSGTWFFPDLIPEPFRSYLAWNPLLQAIELTRVGYYGNIDSPILMPYYPVGVAAGGVVLAILLEYVLRRPIRDR